MVHDKARAWLDEDNRINMIEKHAWYYKVSLSYRSIRRYLNGTLRYIVHNNIGSDKVEDLGSYAITSKEGQNYVVIKRSKRRVPRSLGKYPEWADWDVKLINKFAHNDTHKELELTYLWPLFNSRYIRNSCHIPHDLSDLLTYSNLSIVSQMMLQCIFNPLEDVDLSSKPLPSDDLRCRVGRYNLLYDSTMQEWRIWMVS